MKHSNRAVYRILVLLTFCVCVATGSGGSVPERPIRRVRMKIVPTEVKALQKWVNDGHEPWRLDAASVASAQVLELDPALKGVHPNSLPVRQESATTRRAVLVYASPDSTKSYRIILKRFDWLLPLAKKWKFMIWVVTEVQITSPSTK